MRVYSGTDIGRRRSVNQDYVYVSEAPVGNLPNLFIVADGMGGHNAGDFASAFAVRVMVDSVKEDADFNPVKVIRHGIEVANHELIEQAKKSEERKGMGTTMVVATVVGNYVYVANVGDSRLYVVGDRITQITKDHSLVQEMVRMGELTEEDARNHPDKNIITRALGAEETVNIDFFDFRLEKDSNILMCSDGLSNMVSNEEIQKIIQSKSEIQQKGETLLSLANEHGGKDNIAVVLIEPFTEEVRKC
ncbi:MAG: Stp1/IreP family PP2C-type Ser/Thr phosphatase [Eubacteriales bacterium]|nr:Stp1/IreP family PP2C-type Ser/Thr phosphatase [Eubacteriales bacterium]